MLTAFPLLPFARFAKALATVAAGIVPVAFKVNPPIVRESPVTKSLKVTSLVSVFTPPSVLAIVTIPVPVFAKS